MSGVQFAELVSRARELNRAGDYPAAERLAREALALGETLWPPNEPQLLEAIWVLETALIAGKYETVGDECLELARRVVTISEAGYGPADLRTADALDGLALSLALRREFDEALSIRRRSLSIYELSGEPSHVDEMRAKLGSLLLDMGQYDEAIRMLTLAAEGHAANGHAVMSLLAHRNLGMALLKADRTSEARPHLEIALQIALSQPALSEGPLVNGLKELIASTAH